MRADVRLRASAVAVAPLAVLAGWFKALRVAQKKRATIMHAHWVIPGGVIGAAAAGVDSAGDQPSRIGRVRRRAASCSRGSPREPHSIAARWVTACSEDLRSRAVAIGADNRAIERHPLRRRQRAVQARARTRGRAGEQLLGVADNVPLVVAVGRLVKKKGFEYLIDAAAALKARPCRSSASPSPASGDLDASLRARAQAAGVGDSVQFLGVVLAR